MRLIQFLIPIALFLVGNITWSQTIEYKTITVVESIIPNGLGRSRMISSEEPRDYKEFTSSRTAEDDERNKSDRGEIRLKNFDETKLLNFFNLGGIRFQNIAANDAVVTSKLNDLAIQGWELAFVNSGVESFSGESDSNGIFITRYIFKRLKN
ncbi:hypothetical protein KXJ69_04865 [Aureisphaera sp. CAU 1614]|uniref:DUF4177 domain-containing protein n=1 Tax=Halomarinibacterium sedimenti TaxID=2857106 RepID=A0A9X1FP12_9FLAO|nr:hypothetical protein [Halomarinibacterium sedimenti]MBW2937424.1 hypothetical protein [Halomarinibacterium sedimenti]